MLSQVSQEVIEKEPIVRGSKHEFLFDILAGFPFDSVVFGLVKHPEKNQIFQFGT